MVLFGLFWLTCLVASVVGQVNECVNLILQKPEVGVEEDFTCRSNSTSISFNGDDLLEFCPEDRDRCRFQYCGNEDPTATGLVEIKSVGFEGEFFFRLFVQGDETTKEVIFGQICDAEISGLDCVDCADGRAFRVSQDISENLNVSSFLVLVEENEFDQNLIIFFTLLSMFILVSVFVGFFVFVSRRPQKVVKSLPITQGSRPTLVKGVEASSPSFGFAATRTFDSTFTQTSQMSQFRFAKDNLKQDYKNFSINSGMNSSKLGELLYSKFSLPQFTEASSNSDVNPAEYSGGVSRAEELRFERIKSLSRPFEESLRNLDASLGLSPQRGKLAEIMRIEDEAKTLVEKVCAVLETQILSADEVAGVEAEIENAKSSSRIFSRFRFLQKKKQKNVNLRSLLLRLVTGMNNWFSFNAGSSSSGLKCLILTLIYLRKIKIKEPSFTLTVFNVQRLFSVLMLIAAKFLEDELISNYYWADICSMKATELNQLEEELCFAVEFDFAIENEEIYEMYAEFDLEAKDFQSEIGNSRRITQSEIGDSGRITQSGEATTVFSTSKPTLHNPTLSQSL